MLLSDIGVVVDTEAELGGRVSSSAISIEGEGEGVDPVNCMPSKDEFD